MGAAGGYTLDVQRAALPAWLARVAALQGLGAPDPEARITLLDVGCGQGLGVAVTAALHPRASVHGLDIDRAQLAHAASLADAAGLPNAVFHAGDAGALAGTVPAADLIVAHGLYTWLDRPGRDGVVALLRRCARPGALVYLGTNTSPGWAAADPLRHVIAEHAKRVDGDGPARVKAGFNLAEDLRAAGAASLAEGSRAAAVMDDLAGRTAPYLAHDLLAGGWAPADPAELSRELAPAGLRWAGSADPLDAVTPCDGDAPADPILAETLRDLARVRSFRRDLFVRGEPHPADSVGPVVLAASPPPDAGDGATRVAAALADGAGDETDLANRTGMDAGHVRAGVAPLLASGHALPWRPEVPEAARAACARLNGVLARRAAEGQAYRLLAAVNTGAAVPASLVEMLALDALAAGVLAEAAALGPALADRLAAVDEPLLRDGQPLLDPAAVAAEAEGRAATLIADTLPRWRTLGVEAVPPGI